MTFDLCSIGVVRLLCCSPACYIIDIVRCPSFAINTILGHTPTHAHTPRFMVMSFLLVSWTALICPCHLGCLSLCLHLFLPSSSFSLSSSLMSGLCRPTSNCSYDACKSTGIQSLSLHVWLLHRTNASGGNSTSPPLPITHNLISNKKYLGKKPVSLCVRHPNK